MISLKTTTSTIKLWPLPGGIHPPQNKQQSMQLPLGHLPIPPQLIMPLNQHVGTPAKALVQVGEQVLAGQLIAAAEGTLSANIHASSSGIVSAIGNYVLPHSSGIAAECISIDTDGKHQWAELQSCENYLALDHLALLQKIRAAGVTGLGGAGFPTDVKLSTKSTQVIDTLVINGAECEPYITADDMLMQVCAREIIAGTFLLSHILQYPKRLVIAVEDNKPNAIAALRHALANYRVKKSAKDATIEVLSIPTKYPSGAAKQLIQIITGRETPHGHHSADIGAICINVATSVAAWRAVRFGEPMISRITTLTGDALNTQRNIEVLLGTPIDYVLAQHGFDASKALRVVMGGPMMGFTLPNLAAPVIKTTNCLLAASKKELPTAAPAQACIRCGACADVCPVSLLPQQLLWYARTNDVDQLQAHNLVDCLECGACSYVCPSKIPLVQYYRAAKGTLRQHSVEKEKADHSRQRFEFHKGHTGSEETETEAQGTPRKNAADKVKPPLSPQKTAAATGAEIAPPELDLLAIAKANSVQVTPVEPWIKLERVLQRARSSIDSAQALLAPRKPKFSITEAQWLQQQSRIHQMELNLADTEEKLANFEAQWLQQQLRFKQLELTLADAEKKLADVARQHPIAATTNSAAAQATAERNPAAEAMARAQAKVAEISEEKRRATIAIMQSRFDKALQQAQAEGAATAEILRQRLIKMQDKIAQSKVELAELVG